MVTIDLECGWRHSARRNSWPAIIEAQGLPIDRGSPIGVQRGDFGF